jgi:hypothetical protein
MVFEVFEKKVFLGADEEDFLVTTANFDTTRKKLIAFSVVYLTEIENNFFEVIKYDTSHWCSSCS